MKILKVEDVNPVQVEPIPIKRDEKVIIHYNGYLQMNESAKVYLHYGYGKGAWSDVGEAEMRPSPRGMTTAIPVAGSQRLNFCFRDEHEKWDNNYGNNWSFEIQ